ncbi:meiotically up-regulated gene 117 protein [Mycena sp. CBHHK59/15]|nr:meiotically up-regulated gene 117 protein [Mycena sp. CBHHK59/15]
MTITASVINSGLDCKGSSLCGTLDVASCDAARDKLVNTTVYRTDEGAAQTGVCSGHCGLFVQGDDCQFDGYSMVEAYEEIRGNGCKKCGSKRFLDACLITVNYVASC